MQYATLLTRLLRRRYDLALDESNQFPFHGDMQLLLVELICQRLRLDFQICAKVAEKKTQLSLGRASSSTRRVVRAQSSSYLLCRGGEYQRLTLTDENIEVKQYVRTDLQTASALEHYPYLIWQRAHQRFQPCAASFVNSSATQPNNMWNQLDTLILSGGGSLDEPRHLPSLGCSTKRLLMVPDDSSSVTHGEPTKDELELRKRNFATFVEYINQRHAADGESSVQVQAVDELEQGGLLELKLNMSEARGRQFDWLVLKYDELYCPRMVYHLELHWVSCTGVVVSNFVNKCQRKAKSGGFLLIEPLQTVGFGTPDTPDAQPLATPTIAEAVERYLTTRAGFYVESVARDAKTGSAVRQLILPAGRLVAVVHVSAQGGRLELLRSSLGEDERLRNEVLRSAATICHAAEIVMEVANAAVEGAVAMSAKTDLSISVERWESTTGDGRLR